MDEEGLQELAESIRKNGVLQPVVVRRREDYYELVAGERRWRAAQMAGLTTVPVVVRAVGEQDMLRLALVENLQREDVNPIDAARSYLRLCEEFGLTQEEVAQAVGKSRASVANTMRLLALPEGIQEDVRSGVLSEGQARALMPLIGSPELDMMWSRAVAEQPSVRELERWVKRALKSKVGEAPAEKPKDPMVADMEARMERALGSKVRIVQAGAKGEGKIEITYHSQEDLERLFLFLTRG